MKALQKFVDDRNAFYGKFFPESFIDLSKLDNEVAQQIFGILDGELSPENLHCDGEITAAQARRKAKVLHAAGKDLLSAGYTPTSTWSEFYKEG